MGGLPSFAAYTARVVTTSLPKMRPLVPEKGAEKEGAQILSPII